MKVGIKYCGGCNPYIDRKLLTKRLKDKMQSDTSTFEYFDFDDCDAVLVINGCSVGCTEIPGRKNVICVYGADVDGEPSSEENLPDEVIRRLSKLSPRQA